MRLALGLTVVALVLPLTSCGGNTEATSTAAPSTPAESTPASDAPSSTPSASAPEDPFAPNVDDRALQVGETRDGEAVDTTLLEIKRPLTSPNPYQAPQSPKNEYMGLRVKTCVADDFDESISIGWDEWSVSDRSSGRYQALNATWDEFPTPQYPLFSELSPGQCVSGYVLVSVPKGKPMDKVTLQVAGYEASAEWLLG